jgi:hypothetical protein
VVVVALELDELSLDIPLVVEDGRPLVVDAGGVALGAGVAGGVTAGGGVVALFAGGVSLPQPATARAARTAIVMRFIFLPRLVL